jgi:CRISPR-associated endonuclease Cas1
MFTNKDLEYRTIFVINCSKSLKKLRVANGELLIEEFAEEKTKTLTKMPFQKILALFIIGNASITTPLLEYCTKFGIGIVAAKNNFRPIFFFSNTAEANFLLRKKQYEYSKENIKIPKIIVSNKIENSISLLKKTRLKSTNIVSAKEKCQELILQVKSAQNYEQVMGLEGIAAKIYFAAYFEELDWKTRSPRTKIDTINATLDIGYTILFNFVEIFVRLFGFDVYCGVYHRQWFKRKSLICDLMEVFRCVIDRKVRKAFNTKQFQKDDFELKKNEYRLKLEKNQEYTQIFFEELIKYKNDVFLYIQNYYRAFMRDKEEKDFPRFLI